MGSTITITVGVKALNEAEHIENCLKSALAASAGLGGDVVLADSGSTDATVDIARSLPVRISQFADLSERRCGAAAQLAYQNARGRNFYLLDGDMVVHPGFVAAAVAFLDANPQAAGVGGQMIEKTITNVEFAKRAEAMAADPDYRPGPVKRLDGGGVYRVAAIKAVGYFSDRNLHAFEEYDLAVRLRTAGWTLHRLDMVAMDHYGHSLESYPLLWRRFRGGYFGGPGELLRAAVGRAHLHLVLRLGHVRNSFIVIGWWIALLVGSATAPLFALPALLLLPLLLLRYRQGDWGRAVYTFVMWNAVAFASIRGFFARRKPPQSPIAQVDLSPGSP